MYNVCLKNKYFVNCEQYSHVAPTLVLICVLSVGRLLTVCRMAGSKTTADNQEFFGELFFTNLN